MKVSFQLQAPTVLTLKEKPGYPLIMGWLGARAGPNVLERKTPVPRYVNQMKLLPRKESEKIIMKSF